MKNWNQRKSVDNLCLFYQLENNIFDYDYWYIYTAVLFNSA